MPTSASTTPSSSATTTARSGRAARPTASGRRPATTTGSHRSRSLTSSTSPSPVTSRYYDVRSGSCTSTRSTAISHEPDGRPPLRSKAKWLKERLAASKACFDIVYFHHRPIRPAPRIDRSRCVGRWLQWGAEAVITGHDHAYERFNVDGIPYFVNGLGGAPKYDFPRPDSPKRRLRFNDGYGAMLVTATPADITYEFFTTDGTRRDALTVPANCK